MGLYFNISKNQNLSEKILYKFEDSIYCPDIFKYQNITENFIDQFIKNDTYLIKNIWYLISKYQILSESFIEKHKDKVNWYLISKYQILSESFIDKYEDKVDWDIISLYQHLSEKFIEKYKDKVNWYFISKNQKLSDAFIEKYIDYVNLEYVSIYQHLSEDFIEKHIWELDLYNIGKYQKLSENIINKYKDMFNLSFIYQYQKLSDKFIKDNHIDVYDNNWLYKDTEFKKQHIINSGLYDCYDDYFVAYKAIRPDRYSIFNFQYKYEPGKTYESNCDCSWRDDSFGLNVGIYNYAKDYASPNSIIVKCKIKYEDVGRLVLFNEKVRCFKIEILE